MQVCRSHWSLAPCRCCLDDFDISLFESTSIIINNPTTWTMFCLPISASIQEHFNQRHPVILSDAAASYASQGYYLWQNYKDKEDCEYGQRCLNSQDSGEYLTFDFHLSNASLMMDLPLIRSLYYYEPSGHRFSDFHLGLNAMAFMDWSQMGWRSSI